MNDSILSFLTGGAAGGLLQGVSELFKLGNSVLSTFAKMQQQQHDNAVEILKEENKAANDAAKRFPGWISGTLAIIVFVSAFVLIHVNGWVDIPTALTYAKEPFLNLFGIVKLGGGMGVKELDGFVMTPEFWNVVLLIAGAVFGIKAVKSK